MPLLRELRLRGVPSAAIPALLTYLPNLITLDVEFLGSGLYRSSNMPLPRLRNLTVRTSSMDSMGPQKLWFWIRQLSPYSSLESFTLNAFSVQGNIIVPQSFIMDLASTHKATLRELMVNTTQLTLEDIKYLCRTVPGLEHLACTVASPHVVRSSLAEGRFIQLTTSDIECNQASDRKWSKSAFTQVACPMGSRRVSDPKLGSGS